MKEKDNQDNIILQKKITISAIVPVYNTEKYLDQCITSLVSQTEIFDEIILVNDGSTDHSKEICNRYCRSYPNINLISQRNQGQGAARNVGIANAAGDYIIFIDSDDYIALDTCKKIKEYLRLYNVDVLYYNASMQYDIPAAEKAMIHSAELDYCKMTGKDYLYRAFPESYSASACLAAYRTVLLKGRGLQFPEGTYFEDNLFSLKAALEARDICCIPYKFYVRRCRAESVMTGKVSEKKCADMVYVQHSVWKYLKYKKINIDNVDFTNKFVFSGLLHAVGYLNQAVNEKSGMEQIKKLVFLFLEMWTPLFYAEKKSFDKIIIFLKIMREIEKWDREEQLYIINKFWGSKEKYEQMHKEIEKQFRLETTGRITKLPFRKKNHRVGVYGIGRHTQAVLNLYKRLVGEIYCDLYFIVTSKSNDEFEGRPILSVSEIRGAIDEIIISSWLYQHEMIENLMKEGIDKNKMILLYRKGDICDLVTVDEILNKEIQDCFGQGAGL